MNATVLGDFIKILLPAAIVLYAMYLTVKTFLDKELEKKVLELKARHMETVLPVRLQAYERMCLFLERISPNNLIVRLNDGNFSALEFQQVLLNEIRQEYNHNLSQQVYMSDQAWGLVKAAMEEIVLIINSSAAEVRADAGSIDLARMVFENILKQELDPTTKALKFVKDEIRHIF